MTPDDFFAPPPFNAEAALTGLRRSLRDLKLTERAAGDGLRFDLAGRTVLELHAQADHLAARLVRRPERSPQWEPRSLRSAADVRSLLDELRKRLARWDDERD